MDGQHGDGECWTNSVCMLQVQLIELAAGWDVEGEGKKDDSQVFGLSNCKKVLPSTEKGKLNGADLGRKIMKFYTKHIRLKVEISPSKDFKEMNWICKSQEKLGPDTQIQSLIYKDSI